MLKSMTLEVVGNQPLVCESCEQRVERLLKNLDGVRHVHADAQNQRVEVLFDTARLETTAIADRLRKAGYETKFENSPSS
ncbi:MAG: copper chaperone [Acidobacteria bacterium]|nr:MAG: copper chaperone [Acidobacteriota bacterium]